MSNIPRFSILDEDAFGDISNNTMPTGGSLYPNTGIDNTSPRQNNLWGEESGGMYDSLTNPFGTKQGGYAGIAQQQILDPYKMGGPLNPMLGVDPFTNFQDPMGRNSPYPQQPVPGAFSRETQMQYAPEPVREQKRRSNNISSLVSDMKAGREEPKFVLEERARFYDPKYAASFNSNYAGLPAPVLNSPGEISETSTSSPIPIKMEGFAPLLQATNNSDSTLTRNLLIVLIIAVIILIVLVLILFYKISKISLVKRLAPRVP